MRKKIFILGAGITGLALGYYLRKQYQDAVEITIFEAENRVGGWIQTKMVNGCLFECGPRSFRAESFELIDELGLSSSLIYANQSAKTKYIACEGKLLKVPQSAISFLTEPLGRKCLKAMLGYPFRKKSAKGEDVSCQDYFESRFGKDFTDTFINPLMAGIYAAHPGQLSYQASFPKRKRGVKICSFKEGMQMLPNALANRLGSAIQLGGRALKIKESKSGVELFLDDGSKLFCDHLFSTLAPGASRALFEKEDPLFSLLPDVPRSSVVSVNLGFFEDHLRCDGFGFLVPASQERELLGVLFDSKVFGEHNGTYKTRLSVMLGGTRAPDLLDMNETDLQALAQSFCKKYLGIQKAADVSTVCYAKDAISNYPVGHIKKLQELERHRSSKVRFLGSGFYGVSLVDCIEQAKAISQNLRE